MATILQDVTTNKYRFVIGNIVDISLKIACLKLRVLIIVPTNTNIWPYNTTVILVLRKGMVHAQQPEIQVQNEHLSQCHFFTTYHVY